MPPSALTNIKNFPQKCRYRQYGQQCRPHASMDASIAEGLLEQGPGQAAGLSSHLTGHLWLASSSGCFFRLLLVHLRNKCHKQSNGGAWQSPSTAVPDQTGLDSRTW